MLPWLYLLKLFPNSEALLWNILVLFIVGLPTILLTAYFYNSITLYFVEGKGLSIMLTELGITIFALGGPSLSILAAFSRRNGT